MDKLSLKRVYEKPSGKDGYRMLVDRLWPRGLKKEEAKLNEWNKAIAPSNELRLWFAHKPERFKAFEKEYKKELSANMAEVEKIKALAEKRHLTLVYAAKEPSLSHAVILLKFLQAKP